MDADPVITMRRDTEEILGTLENMCLLKRLGRLGVYNLSAFVCTASLDEEEEKWWLQLCLWKHEGILLWVLLGGLWWQDIMHSTVREKLTFHLIQICNISVDWNWSWLVHVNKSLGQGMCVSPYCWVFGLRHSCPGRARWKLRTQISYTIRRMRAQCQHGNQKLLLYQKTALMNQ